MTKLMQVICAWCQADMGTRPGNHGVTHGICDACLAKQLARVEANKKKATTPARWGSGLQLGAKYV